jgi:hypothetical protein
MEPNNVDFKATTTAVLKNFDPGLIDLVVQLLEQRNTVTADDNRAGTFADIRDGYGLLVLADKDDAGEPFSITTEFLVPSSDLAASFMLLWRRWCDRRNVNSRHGLQTLMNTVTEDIKTQLDSGNHYTISNLAIGLMGAVLDNYPETVGSMRWSVDNGFAPCLVIARGKNQARCGVCYGGKYLPRLSQTKVA